MPADIFDEYAYWLSLAPTAGTLIQGVAFHWANNTASLHLGNHITVPTLCIYENGANVNLVPYQFTVTSPERSGSTEAQVTFEGPVQGPVFGLFNYLRGYQCNFDVVMVVRYFLYPSRMGRPLSKRPERYLINSMTFTRRSVQMQGSMARLPRFQAGIPYTIDEYPGLFV